MSAATAQAPAGAGPTRRRTPRYPLSQPVDITVLRSGIPATIPGRALDVGEGGLSAVLAGELHPGESVGVELHLYATDAPLQARAVVRHQSRLRFGVEFLGMPPGQLDAIRRWARQTQTTDQKNQSAEIASQEPSTADASLSQTRHSTRLRPLMGFVLAMVVVATGLLSWQWYRAWEELESHVPRSVPRKLATANPARARVSADVIEQLITHKVEPVYPESARQKNIQGIVVLKVVIGQDGSVLDVRPVSGPETLAPAAIDAVKWWRFQPYRINGNPVEVETTIAIEFRTD